MRYIRKFNLLFFLNFLVLIILKLDMDLIS